MFRHEHENIGSHGSRKDYGLGRFKKFEIIVCFLGICIFLKQCSRALIYLGLDSLLLVFVFIVNPPSSHLGWYLF